MTGDVKVKCGTCKACCYGQIVALQPEDNALLYETVPTVWGLALARREDGACIYLGPEGCNIYPIRPVLCRGFSCIGMYARMDKSIRDMTALADPVIRAGKHRHDAMVNWKPEK